MCTTNTQCLSTKLRFLFRKLKFAEWREIAICWRHRPDCTLCTQRRCARNCALVKVVRNLYENFNVDCIASAKTFDFVSIWVGQVHAPCVKSFTQKLLAHTRACRNRLLNHSKQIGVGCRRAEVTRFTNFDVHFYLVIIYHKVLKREDIEFKKMISQYHYHTSFLQ